MIEHKRKILSDGFWLAQAIRVCSKYSPLCFGVVRSLIVVLAGALGGVCASRWKPLKTISDRGFAVSEGRVAWLKLVLALWERTCHFGFHRCYLLFLLARFLRATLKLSGGCPGEGACLIVVATRWPPRRPEFRHELFIKCFMSCV